jgi:hypothetical protein
MVIQREEFLNEYLPMVAKGAIVNVFLAKDEGMLHWKKLKDKAADRDIKLWIYPCEKATMHDRFITTSDSELSIGTGILFYDKEKNVSKLATFVYKKRKTSDGIEYEKALAGGNVYDPQ